MFVTNMMRGLSRDFLFVGNLFNGWLVSYYIMNSLWIHIPILISFVAGDQLAGEATGGTYRLILTRPVSRTRIFFAKALVTFVYTAIFVLFLGILSVGLALALLGRGDLLILGKGMSILILPSADVLWRFLLAYGFAILTMSAVSSIAFFFSSFVENAIGPIIATVGFLAVLVVLTALPVQVLDGVRPHLLTSHMDLWQNAFEDPVPWDRMRVSIGYLLAYSAVSIGAAWWVFVKKDILS
jgi:ABC-2 type transport system permease protein